MRAAVFAGVGDISIRDAPIPALDAGDLLLRVRAATICGTDLRICAGLKTRGVRAPSILGHEFAGDIAAVGAGLSGWRVGQAVTAAPVIACGACYYCQADLGNLCANRTALGYEYDGAFAQYIRLPAAALRAGNVFELPETVSCEAAALAEPLSCCLNGQQNLGGIQPGDRVLIIGAGPIGVMHLQLAKAAPGTRVIVSDPSDHRRKLAGQNGADLAINPLVDDLGAAVLDLTAGIGVDKVIMAVGVPEILPELIRLTRKNGALNLFAGFPPRARASIDLNDIHYRQIRISGASASTPAQFGRALDLLASGTIDADAIITDRFPLAQFDEALTVAKAGQGLKVALLP
ncbi:MAG: zinc-dependent dehydrogenase [Chloroflexota bacterium]|nr:zinc-dependent dehydrogenase [Chloroflexota bacterium]